MCRTCISYSKTGSKKRATCFVTFLENELNSDVARCTIHALTNNQQIRLQGFISWVVKRATSAIQLILRQSCKKSCKFFVYPFDRTFYQMGDVLNSPHINPNPDRVCPFRVHLLRALLVFVIAVNHVDVASTFIDALVMTT